MSSTAVGAVLGSLVGGLVIGALLRCPTREFASGNNFFSNEKILVTDADGNLVVKSINELKQYIDGKTGANTNLITGAEGVNDRIKKIDAKANANTNLITGEDGVNERLDTIESLDIETIEKKTSEVWLKDEGKAPLAYVNGYSDNLGKAVGIPYTEIEKKMRKLNVHGKYKYVYTYNDVVSACIRIGFEKKVKYVGIRKTKLLNNSYHTNFPDPCWYQEGDPAKKETAGASVTSWEKAFWKPEHRGTNVTYKL